jgi:hypothetical protein
LSEDVQTEQEENQKRELKSEKEYKNPIIHVGFSCAISLCPGIFQKGDLLWHWSDIVCGSLSLSYMRPMDFETWSLAQGLPLKFRVRE